MCVDYDGTWKFLRKVGVCQGQATSRVGSDFVRWKIWLEAIMSIGEHEEKDV